MTRTRGSGHDEPGHDGSEQGRSEQGRSEQGSIAFRPAPRSAPRASGWSTGADDRLSVRINPRQPALPWADDTPNDVATTTIRSVRPARTPAHGDPRPIRRRPAAPDATDSETRVVRIVRFAPVASPHDGTPDPAQWAVRLAEAILEVLAGLRPLTQLERLLSPTALTQVAQRVRRRKARDRPSLYALHLHQDTPRAVEVAAVYGWPEERCAMAFRISSGGNGWVCTALTLPAPPKRRTTKKATPEIDTTGKPQSQQKTRSGKTARSAKKTSPAKKNPYRKTRAGTSDVANTPEGTSGKGPRAAG